MNDNVDSRSPELGRSEELLRIQIEILEGVARNDPVEDLLDRLCRLVRAHLGRGGCAVVLPDENRTALHVLAAQGFPAGMAGCPPEMQAAFFSAGPGRDETLIAADILTDPKWAACRRAAQEFGIRAAWAQPVPAEPGSTTASFVFVFDAPAQPTPWERLLLLSASRLAGNALQSRDTRRSLLEGEAHYRRVIAAVGEGITVRDREDRVVSCNPAAESLLGFRRDATGIWQLPAGHGWVRDDGSPFPAELYPPRVVMRTGKPRIESVIGFELPGSETRWLSIRSQPLTHAGETEPYAVVSSFDDITVRRKAEKRLAVRNRLLEIAAQGLPTPTTLDRINLYIESCTTGARCSVLLLEERGERLRHASAPSLPPEYNAIVDGLAVGPRAGSCGTAVYRDASVVVADTRTDPLWADYREIAIRFGLLACWSTPIRGDGGKTIGTFAMYFDEPHMPTVDEVGLVENATYILGLILQRQASKSALEASELRYRSLVQVMAEGVLVLDSRRRVQTWNEAADRLFGISWAALSGREAKPEGIEVIREDGTKLPPEEYPSTITLHTGAPQLNVVLGLRRPDGTLTWLSVNSQPLTSPPALLPHAVLLSFNDITERKRAEQALQDSESRYRTIIESTNDIVWDWDLDQDTMWVSDRHLEYFPPVPEAGARHWLESSIHPEERDEVMHRLDAALAGNGSVWSAEYRLRGKNGEYAWIRDRTRIVRDPDQRPRRIMGVTTNINDQRVAEMELIRSNRLLKALSQAQTRFIAEADPRASFDEMLSQFLAITESRFGFIAEILYDGERPYLRTFSITDISWDPESRARLARNGGRGLEFHNMQTLFGQVVTEGDTVIANEPDGDPRRGGLPPGHPSLTSFIGLPVRHAGKLIGAIGLANRSGGYDAGIMPTLEPLLSTCGSMVAALHNDRRRQNAEQALRESEQRWQFALEGSREGVWDWDVTTGRVYSSRRLVDMLGYTDAEWTYTVDQWTGLLHADDRDRTLEEIRKHLRGETDSYNAEIRLRCRNGEYRWFLDRGIVIARDEQGAPRRMIGTQADITERKQAEEELQSYRNQLEELVRRRTMDLRDINEELEAFAYSISHDLRTPLRGIDGFSQALLEDYGDRIDDAGRGYIARIRTAAQRLGKLIDSMLQLSGVTRHNMRDSEVSLTSICREIVDDLRRQDGTREVTVAIAPDLVVHGDPQLLRVLMENLLSNAWKYTGRRKHAHIEFGRHGTDGAFFVKDDGAGFDPDYAHKLFVPFQRLHDAREFEGTGVGLASVQRIVRRHGGRIWAESRPEQGATFFFTLGTDAAVLAQ